MQEPVSTTENENIVYGPTEESQAEPRGRTGPSGNLVGSARGVPPSLLLALPFVRRGEGEAKLPPLEDIRKYGSVGAAEGALHARGILRAPLVKGDVLADGPAADGWRQRKGRLYGDGQTQANARSIDRGAGRFHVRLYGPRPAFQD